MSRPTGEAKETEARHTCCHPSLKCSCCGRYYDLLRPGESQLVEELRSEIRILNGKATSRVAEGGQVGDGDPVDVHEDAGRLAGTVDA